MPIGRVKWFDAKKGYGFIVDEEGNDIFVHYSVIVTNSEYKKLEKGVEVEYELKIDDKGLKAKSVKEI